MSNNCCKPTVPYDINHVCEAEIGRGVFLVYILYKSFCRYDCQARSNMQYHHHNISVGGLDPHAEAMDHMSIYDDSMTSECCCVSDSISKTERQSWKLLKIPLLCMLTKLPGNCGQTIVLTQLCVNVHTCTVTALVTLYSCS